MTAEITEMMQEKRSDRLKELRHAKKMRQRDVAAALGLSHGGYAGWEFHEDREIPKHHLKRLAEILDTTPDFILHGFAGPQWGHPDGGELGTSIRYALNLMENGEVNEVVMRNLSDFDLVDIPYVPVSAYATFGENCFGNVTKADMKKITVLAKALRKTDAARAVGIEIKGRSMEPNYPEDSIVVAYAIPRSRWHLAEGVCVFSLSGEVIIKRIAQNNLRKDGEIVLISDNPDYPGEKGVAQEEIICIYEVGDFAYAPKR